MGGGRYQRRLISGAQRHDAHFYAGRQIVSGNHLEAMQQSIADNKDTSNTKGDGNFAKKTTRLQGVQTGSHSKQAHGSNLKGQRQGI